MTYSIQPKKFFDFLGKADSELILSDIAFFLASQIPSELQYPFNTWIRERDYRKLISYTIDYSSEYTLLEFSSLRQLLALYQKNDDIDIGVNRDEVAYNAFIESEQNCKKINGLFRNAGPSLSEDASTLIRCAKRKIADILGECPSFSRLQFGFGPGSSTTVKGMTGSRFKLQSVPVCSKESFKDLENLWGTVPHWGFLHKGKARIGYGELSFVPKNAKTSRSIIIEPILNTFVQKGIGSFIRDRLMINGVDLKDQSINQARARIGSLNGCYATIDLKAASDSIAYGLVLELLPFDWFKLLSTWRTGTISSKYGKRTFELEKFSSMGNGFTFELESLIFYCISLAVCEINHFTPDVSVYGDDLIVPTHSYQLIKNALLTCGFEINTSKSFFSGVFRESCGGDYYDGYNIRPFYFKDRITPARLVGFLNHSFRSDVNIVSSDLRDFLIKIITELDCLLVGPDGFGDGHVVSHDYDKTVKTKHQRDGWEGYTFKTFSKVPRKFHSVCPIGDDLDSLYQTYASPLIYGNAREHDPYVIGGGYKVKKTSIYKLIGANFSNWEPFPYSPL